MLTPHPIQASAVAGLGGNTKRQCSAPGQLEVRMLRDRAGGTSSFCISILHLPPPHCFPGHSPTAFLPRSHSRAWNVTGIYSVQHAQVPLRFCSAFLLAPRIEDASPDLEIILCKILPGMTCRGTSSHHFHSVQQFGFKASRFGKTKGCWQNRGENYPVPTAFSWTLLFSSLFS